MNGPGARMQKTLIRARKRAGSLAIQGLLQGMSSLVKLHPLAKPARHGVRVTRDVAYLPSGNPAHTLDIYHPGTPGPHPVVFYVHGGGFRILSKDTHWAMALSFARRGYLVFNINYRLAPDHPYPEALKDTIDAYAWVQAHAQAHGGDLSRLILAGESAGGNLVTALAVAQHYARPEPFAKLAFDQPFRSRAVLPAGAVMSASELLNLRERGLSTFVADRMDEITRAYLPKLDAMTLEELEMADPVRVFESGAVPAFPLPAFFLPVGTRDPVQHDSERAEAALRKLGVDAHVKLYEGGIHSFHAFVWRPLAKACWRDMFAFLHERGL